eukprot:m.16113 g.16113  ORF g.16113 m.16113 type:complete len:119 (+) comp3476_c0_seq1:950-1306(+)
MAVANDAERLLADLVAAHALLVPNAAVNLHATVAGLAGQHDNESNDELRDAARVGKGRVEDGDAKLGGVLQVGLSVTKTKKRVSATKSQPQETRRRQQQRRSAKRQVLQYAAAPGQGG